MIGRTIGHYQILEILGRGGMGIVYKARDTRLNRFAALKVLPADRVADPERKLRFIREARAASALNHPNIITIYEIDQEDGIDFIAMEFVAGRTLDAVIPRKGLRLEDMLKYAIQVADALAAAHVARIIHGDVKPRNVMVTDTGLVKVLDFGLARLIEREEDASLDTTETRRPATQDRTIMGTVAYMSPEQVQGRPLDARSDNFAFGVLLYEMVTGRRAFEGNSDVGILSAILEKEPVPARDLVLHLPHDIDRLIRQCLQKKPERRWQHIIDLKMLLEEISREIEHGERQKPERPRPLWPYYAPGLLGLLVAGSVLIVHFWRGDVAQPRPTAPVVTMLTADEGLTTFPAVSNDGNLVAYASDRSGQGNLDIWLQQIGGGEPIRLTRDASDESNPDFSPDGTRIAFRSEREEGGIYTTPTFGGEAQLIAPKGRNPKFSPDGRRIAFWVGMEGSGFLPGAARVMLAPAGGGFIQPLPQDLANAQYPVWSPRGDELLVLGRPDAQGDFERTLDWWIVPLDGSHPRKTGAFRKLWAQGLSVPTAQYQFIPLVWVKEGNRIVFAASQGDTTNLWQIALSPKTGQVRDFATQLTSGTGFESQVGFAGASSRMVYAALSLNVDIWTLLLDADRGAPLGDLTKLTQDVAFDASPSLSRDGSLLAYVSGRSGSWALRERDLRTGREWTIAWSRDRGSQPKISGDGSAVVYCDRDYRIYRIGSQGGAAEILCDRCGLPTDVSNDGGKILFEPVEPPDDVMMLDAGSRQELHLIRVAEQPELYGGRFSPDGSWVAFHVSTGRSGKMTVFVAPMVDAKTPARSEWIQITDGKFREGDVAWSPNGQLLYYLSDRDSFRCVWASRLDGATKKPLGNPFCVQHFHHARRSLRSMGNRGETIGMSVAPGRLVLALGELTGNLWVRETERASR